MKTSMKHINESTEIAERTAGKLSVLPFTIYVVLFGAWLALQLHK